MKVTFWSPVPGQSGTTSNILAIAIMAAWKEKKKVLLINGQYKKKNIEEAILSINEESIDILNSTGIDWLIRNVKMRCLNQNTIKISSLSFYKDRLDVITGTTKENEKMYEEELLQTLPTILDTANDIYDLVMIDAPSGKTKLSEMMKNEADLIVANLPQNRHTINDYFRKYPENLDKTVFLIGNYSRESRYNIKNLQRIFKCMKKNVCVVPYSPEFKDSFSETSVIKFLQKADIENNLDFHSDVLKAARLIIKKGGKE